MSDDPSTMETLELPRWSRDLLRFLPLKSQFLLSGNIRDRYPCDFQERCHSLSAF